MLSDAMQKLIPPDVDDSEEEEELTKEERLAY